jgi:hypothetical protein
MDEVEVGLNPQWKVTATSKSLKKLGYRSQMTGLGSESWRSSECIGATVPRETTEISRKAEQPLEIKNWLRRSQAGIQQPPFGSTFAY